MQIGNWSVDAGLNELRQADRVVRLEPKVMEVLLFMAAHPGQVVSREALLGAVWPDVIVGDDALTQTIIKLRKALGDDPKQPSHIQTIPKRGYKLLAEVTQNRGLATTTAADTGTNSLPRRHLYAAVAILILIVAGAGLWVSSHTAQKPIPTETKPADGTLGLLIEPFKPLESSPGSKWVATGLTSELMNDLSHLSSLRVFSATNGKTPPTANYKVEGVVQDIEGRLRIFVHLTDAQSGRELWSERFDRPMHDLLSLQSELSNQLINVLPLKLSEAERERVAHRYTRSLEAYELFVRAQSALLARSPAENQAARDLYQQAIQKDPAFARAYAGLAMTHAVDYRNQWTTGSKDALARAFDLAETARQLDPNIAETYWTLGFVHVQFREHKEALEQLARAVRLNPSYADAYALMGGIYTYMGKPEESLPLLRTAQRLNPESGYLYFQLLGRAYFFMNDFDQARINLTEALARNAVDLESHVYLAATLAKQRDHADASWEVEEIRSLEPGFRTASWLDSYPLSDSNLRRRLGSTLSALGL